jgi:hypothetical protein
MMQRSSRLSLVGAPGGPMRVRRPDSWWLGPLSAGAGAFLAACVLGGALAGCGGDDEVRDRSRGGPYDPCVTRADCPASTGGCGGVIVDYVDYRTAERSFCTSECTTDLDCPPDPPGLGGACVDFGGGAAICYRRCAADEECPPDFGCVDRLPAPGGGESFIEPICLPIR